MSWYEKFIKKQGTTFKGIDTAELNSVSNAAIQYNTAPRSFLRLGTSLIRKAELERVNQLESQLLFSDEELSKFERIRTILENSDFEVLRKKQQQELFSVGIKYMMIVPFGDDFIIDSWRVIESSIIKVGKNITYIELQTSTIMVIDGIQTPLYARLTHINGRTILEYFYHEGKDDEYAEIPYEKYEFPETSKMVGSLFRANFEGLPELVFAGVLSPEENLNYLGQEVIEETIRGKTTWSINNNFNDISKDDFEEHLRSGRAVIEEESFNAKMQGGTSVVFSGTQATTFSQMSHAYTEDKIKEFLTMMRDSTNTGANKHSLEITLQNSYASETLWNIRSIREQDYKTLFTSLAELIGEDITDKIEVKLSKIEQAKITILEEQIQMMRNKGSEVKIKKDKEEKDKKEV